METATDNEIKEKETVEEKSEEKKEYTIDSISEDLLSVSSVFGQSEEEIEREFKEFKAAKLFKRIQLDATNVNGDEDIEYRAEECNKYGFGAIIVLPQFIITAKKKLRNKNVEVIGAISYPYGEEIPYTTVKSARKAASKGADVLLVPVGVALIKRGAYDVIRQTFKKIKKKVKCNVCALIECGSLGIDEVDRTIKALMQVGITSFRSSTGFKNAGDEFANLKSMRAAFKTGNLVTAYADSTNGQNAIRLMTVADRIATKNATQMAEEIKGQLNCR